MARQLDLTKVTQKTPSQGFKLTVTASNPVDGMVTGVFVMRRSVFDPVAQTYVDEFSHVASATELARLPTSAPLSGQFEFRVATFTETYETIAEADDVWAAVVSEVGSLIRSLNLADDLGTPETITITG